MVRVQFFLGWIITHYGKLILTGVLTISVCLHYWSVDPFLFTMFGSGITLTKLVGVLVLCFSTSEIFVVCDISPLALDACLSTQQKKVKVAY